VIFGFTPEVFVQLVMALGVIPALFVCLLFYTLKQHQADKLKSEQREQKLLKHIEKSDETHLEISGSIKEMSVSMQLMQKDIEILKDRTH